MATDQQMHKMGVYSARTLGDEHNNHTHSRHTTAAINDMRIHAHTNETCISHINVYSYAQSKHRSEQSGGMPTRKRAIKRARQSVR
eukprot:scaffold138110_cov32-Prasinocladus_malaysianus.AAC.1